MECHSLMLWSIDFRPGLLRDFRAGVPPGFSGITIETSSLLLWPIDPLLSDALLFFYDNKHIHILKHILIHAAPYLRLEIIERIDLLLNKHSTECTWYVYKKFNTFRYVYIIIMMKYRKMQQTNACEVQPCNN